MFSWLSGVIDPLNHVIFVLGNDHVTWAELLGFLTGGACVLYTVKSNILNFPVGIANSAFFLILFGYASLWADMSLQIVFIVLGFLGWWQWVRGRAQAPLEIRRAGPLELGMCAGFVVVATVGLTYVLRAADDAAPFWDALTTALSLSAQWLLNAKRLQTWWFWIAADLVYVPLYIVKHLTLTAIVYVLFLALCVLGLQAWTRLATKVDVVETVLV